MEEKYIIRLSFKTSGGGETTEQLEAEGAEPTFVKRLGGLEGYEDMPDAVSYDEDEWGCEVFTDEAEATKVFDKTWKYLRSAGDERRVELLEVA